MRKIDKLKYAVFYEWSYDPPGGSLTLYYPVWGTTYKSLLGPANDVYSNVSSGVYDDESDELDRAYNRVKASRRSINSFGWDNGGLGCGCSFIAEGTEIAQAAVDFYRNDLEPWMDYIWEDEEDEDDDEDDLDELAEDENDTDEDATERIESRGTRIEKLIQRALDNPDDYDTVINLLEMIDEIVEERNDSLL